MTGAKTLTNPAWVKFLLYNNTPTPTIRLALRTFFPDTHHAEIIVRLEGNQPLDAQSRLGGLRAADGGQVPLRQRHHPHHRRPRRCSRTSTTTSRAACSCWAASPRWS